MKSLESDIREGIRERKFNFQEKYPPETKIQIPSHNQMKNILSKSRKRMGVNSIDYVLTHRYTNNGKPFLRAFYNSFEKIKGNLKDNRYLIWASDFNLSNLRVSEHFYIDGTFNVTPFGYTQLLTIMIEDVLNVHIKMVFL